MNSRERYLAHHQRLGAKWGVMNGPPYPLDMSKKEYKAKQKAAAKRQKAADKIANKGLRDPSLRQKHTIPAGTKMYRVTTNSNEGMDGNKYVSYYDVDRQHYRAGWVRRHENADKVYEDTYTLKEDLVVPGRDELKSVISDILKDNPEKINNVGKQWIDYWVPEGSFDRRMYSIDKETGIESEAVWQSKVDGFMKELRSLPMDDLYFTAAQSFGLNKELRTEVIDALKKRGYNAMTDEASVGGQNGWTREGIDPLIIFDGSRSLNKEKTKKIGLFGEGVSLSKNQRFRTNVRFEDDGSGQWSAI